MGKLNFIFQERVNLSNAGFNVVLHESCYQIKLEASKTVEGDAKVVISCSPDGSHGYELLVDYQLEVGELKEFVECDKWDVSKKLLELNCAVTEFDLALAINVREIIVAQDLSQSTSFRNFQVLSFESIFYVNTAQLNELKGKLFKEWYNSECQGEKSAVVQKIDADQLKTLLNACCAYSTIIIHRLNFYSLLDMSRRWSIIGLLRSLETYIMESTTIHKIRKLEFAVEYQMARLADVVLRSFGSKISRTECLFDYLSKNGNNLDDVHPEILEMFEIYQNHIVL